MDLKTLKEGDSVIYKNVGYGLTSYEPGNNDVIEIKDGKLYTNCFNSTGLEWFDPQKCWKFDGGLGLITYAISADDKAGLTYIEEYGNE